MIGPRPGDEPVQLPGPESFWSAAFAVTWSLPLPVFLCLWVILDVEVEMAAFVALATLIGSQLALFASVLPAWAISRRRRGDADRCGLVAGASQRRHIDGLSRNASSPRL